MKIVIVGGGTAGWISSLILAEANVVSKKFDITVIDSSTIPTIGAGEGSTGVLSDLVNTGLRKLGIDEIDFLNKTEATLKLGIRFKDWNGVGTEYLSPIQASTTYTNFIDNNFYYALTQNKAHLSSEGGFAMENNLSTYFLNKKKTNGAHSYHFDAHEVGKYLKNIAIKNNVTHIDSEVAGLNRDVISGDLKSLSLKNGQTISADLWIDCSGFSRVLVGPMKCGWKSYSKWLPTNTAIPFIQKYEDNDAMRLETLAWAQPNGWMWQIPTQQRYGCGYVYSDMFTTYDNAVDELQKNIGKNIEPLRTIKFDSGRLENFWVNNVIGVGLAGSFLEPLQATSIHSTIVQMGFLKAACLRESVTNTIIPSNIKLYNDYIGRMVDDFADLIQMQYMTQREDTEFWKYCKYALPKTDFVKYIMDISKYRTVGMLDFNNYFGGAGWAVWSWTLAGLDFLSKENAIDGLNSYDAMQISKELYDKSIKFGKINSMKYLNSKEFMNALRNKEIKK
jgi:tryptophan halogenase